MSLHLLGASLYLACGGAVFLLGVLVLREGPGERLHRITATMMFFGGFGPLLGGVGILLPHYGPQDLVTTDISSTFSCIWQFFFPSLLLFALVFPTEKAILTRFSRFSLFLYGPHLFHLVLVVFLAGSAGALTGWRLGGGGEGLIARAGTVVSTLAGLFVSLLTRFHIRFFSVVDVVYSIAAIVILAWSLRSLRTAKIRRQLSVILFGLGTCVGLYAAVVPVPIILSTGFPENLRVILVSLALLVGTGSIAFAIVRRSFLDVGTVVRRAILLSATSGTMVLAYFITARQLDRALHRVGGIDLPLFQTLFVILAIVFFHPILGRLEETVDRLLAGDRVAYRNVVARLGRDMTAILDLEKLKSTVLVTLREALAVDRAYLVLREREGEDYRVTGVGLEEFPAIDPDHPLIRQMGGHRDPLIYRDLLDEIEEVAEREESGRMTGRLDSKLLIPIHLPEGGGSLGFFSFGPKVTGGRYNAEEVTLLSILATQVGIAVRNARLHEEAVARRVVDEELAMARSIQESIFSQRKPDFEGVDVAALSVPSRQVGGDYYDLVPMRDGDLGVAIGDVSGKGVPAALLMSMLHASLHAQMNGTVSVSAIMGRMNRILCRSTSPEKFATFFFGIYNRNEGVLRFSNGGHNFPILMRADGTVLPLVAGGLILGVSEATVYEEQSVSLVGGDLLVFYTDGVTEETAGDDEDHLFGEERLIGILERFRHESAEVILRAVREEVVRFTGREGFSDDFTLIVLRAVGGESA